jgi:hypothetical protein
MISFPSLKDNYFFVQMQASAFSECQPTIQRSFLSAVDLSPKFDRRCRVKIKPSVKRSITVRKSGVRSFLS